jgi:hypothetical protein
MAHLVAVEAIYSDGTRHQLVEEINDSSEAWVLVVGRRVATIHMSKEGAEKLRDKSIYVNEGDYLTIQEVYFPPLRNVIERVIKEAMDDEQPS